MVSLASHVLHDVKSQVLNQVTSSHQVEVAFFWLEVSIQHQKAAMLRRGPGCLRQPFCPFGGPNLETAEVSTLDCGIDPVGGPGAITATAGSFFFLAGLLGIVTTYCSNTWVQDELNMSQILYQTISRGISSVMFVHQLCFNIGMRPRHFKRTS